MNMHHTSEAAGDMAERMAHSADESIADAKRATWSAANAVQAGLDRLRGTVPRAISRAASRAEDLTRRSADTARHAASEVRHRALDLGDATTAHVRARPLESLLIATAVGAAAMLLLGWMARSRGSSYRQR